MKKVLWLTSFFPPRINVATNRNVKFLKYLPQFGWKSIVICPGETSQPTNAGRQLLDQLSPEITIMPAKQDPFLYVLDRKEKTLVFKYLSYLMNNVIPPDGHIFWNMLTLRHIDRVMKKHRPDIVYTTCSPFSINILGAWIKYRYWLPWVTDFRDLWTLNPIPRKVLKSYIKAVSSILEYYYLKFCDVLIVNTVSSQERMALKYPFLNGKIKVISNGFDPDDIHVCKNRKAIADSFLFSGLINKESDYTPVPVLKLLSHFIEEGILKNSIELHYAGDQEEEFKALCNLEGIGKSCITHGYLDHHNFYQLIQTMSYVMLCMPCEVDTTSWIPARLYDYIGNKSRVICLTNREGEVVKILEKYGKALVLFYDDPEHVKIKKLKSFLSTDAENKKVSDAFVNRFSRKKLTLELSEIFQATIGD